MVAKVTIWLPERIAELKKLAALGLTRDQISMRLTQSFGISITDMAVAAQAGKLKLYIPNTLTPAAKSGPKVNKPLPLEKGVPGKYTFEQVLEHDGCRWSSGSKRPYTFCGRVRDKASVHVKDGNSPYCATHTERAYVKPIPQRANTYVDRNR